MLSKDNIFQVMRSGESDRVEFTVSHAEKKIAEAVCAFSNDFANHKKPGIFLLGVSDDGSLAGMTIGDKILQSIGDVRSNGNVLPQPILTISEEVYHLEQDGKKGDVLVIEVHPHPHPPVRYDGKVMIRVGPRNAVASEADERRLTERRTSSTKTFDARPANEAHVDDLSQELFTITYLPQAVDRETIAANNRSLTQKLASLRFYDLTYDRPTHAGVLTLGLNPRFFFPGAYIQFIAFEGDDTNSGIQYEKELSGALITELRIIDDFINQSLIKQKPVSAGGFKENTVYNYPPKALREFVMNAIMHRDYESNAPIYIRQFANRIEIINPGGLYGDVRKENFPNASDYRNPVVAEAMKTMGYVNRFNYGIQEAQRILAANGNPAAEFNLDLVTKFLVTVSISTHWS